MHFSKAEKINILNMVYRGQAIPRNQEYDFILFDLLEEGMIVLGSSENSISITYFGLKELEAWDPELGVSVNYQLVMKPYAEA